MTLALADLENKTIYLETRETLAQRIDFSWNIYSNPAYNDSLRTKAKRFLVDAFDLPHVPAENLNNVIHYLMLKREKHRRTNPEYIPGKAPQLPFDAARIVPQRTQRYGQSDSEEVRLAIRAAELVDVNNRCKELDASKPFKYLSAQERSQYRVHIISGTFIQNGELFNTSSMSTPNQPGYGAFTLNTKGELSIFTHENRELLHSSMHQGAPLFCAGEIQIVDGFLKTISDSSGHYQPSLFNMYRLLEYFSRNGIDIRLAEVITLYDPSEALDDAVSTEVQMSALAGDTVFKTPAIHVYRAMNYDLKEALGCTLTDLYNEIDAFNGKQNQEPEDNFDEITTHFKQALDTFYSQFSSQITPSELQWTIKELKNLVSLYETKYKALLGQINEKNQSNLVSPFTLFHQRVAGFKKQVYTLELPPHAEFMKRLC